MFDIRGKKRHRYPDHIITDEREEQRLKRSSSEPNTHKNITQKRTPPSNEHKANSLKRYTRRTKVLPPLQTTRIGRTPITSLLKSSSNKSLLEKQILRYNVLNQKKGNYLSGIPVARYESSDNSNGTSTGTNTSTASTTETDNSNEYKYANALMVNYNLAQLVFAEQKIDVERLGLFNDIENLRDILKVENGEMEVVGGGMQSHEDSLLYLTEDTTHDFHGTRNSSYPEDNPGGEAFVKDTEKWLTPIKGATWYDDPFIFYNYYGPAFEEKIKIEFFTNSMNPPHKNYDHILKTKFYCNVDKLNINNAKISDSLKEFIKNGDVFDNDNNEIFAKKFTEDITVMYNYYILDACMSVNSDPFFIKKTTQLDSMCCLWDPAGAHEFPIGNKEERVFIDDKNEFGLNFEESTFIDTIVFDSKYKDDNNNNKSLYDDAYDELLNKNCLEGKYKITFKLRLWENSGKYKVCICVLQGGEDKFISKPTKSFALADLAVGMSYCDYLKESKSPMDKLNITRELQEFIDNIFQLQGDDTQQNKKNEKCDDIKILLARLKSSGDHGSARTAKIVNDHCGRAKKSTMYLSGDQLCFVYAIMHNTPTLFRYYAGLSTKNTECRKNDDCDDCVNMNFSGIKDEHTHFLGIKDGHAHFLGFYNPITTAEIAQKKNEILEKTKNKTLVMLNTLKTKAGIDTQISSDTEILTLTEIELIIQEKIAEITNKEKKENINTIDPLKKQIVSSLFYHYNQNDKYIEIQNLISMFKIVLEPGPTLKFIENKIKTFSTNDFLSELKDLVEIKELRRGSRGKSNLQNNQYDNLSEIIKNKTEGISLQEFIESQQIEQPRKEQSSTELDPTDDDYDNQLKIMSENENAMEKYNKKKVIYDNNIIKLEAYKKLNKPIPQYLQNIKDKVPKIPKIQEIKRNNGKPRGFTNKLKYIGSTIKKRIAKLFRRQNNLQEAQPAESAEPVELDNMHESITNRILQANAEIIQKDIYAQIGEIISNVNIEEGDDKVFLKDHIKKAIDIPQAVVIEGGSRKRRKYKSVLRKTKKRIFKTRSKKPKKKSSKYNTYKKR